MDNSIRVPLCVLFSYYLKIGFIMHLGYCFAIDKNPRFINFVSMSARSIPWKAWGIEDKALSFYGSYLSAYFDCRTKKCFCL